MVTLILVDSNVWIFLNIENFPEHAAAKNKIDELRRQGIVTNIVVVSEVFHQLSKMLGKVAALVRVDRILDSSDVSYIPIDENVAKKSVSLAGKRAIRINDAIIAQQSLELNAGVLTDNVKDFRKVPRLKIISLY